MRRISWDEYQSLVYKLGQKLLDMFPGEGEIFIKGIPRGGGFVAYMLSYWNPRFTALSPTVLNRVISGKDPIILLDDILELGETRTKGMRSFIFHTSRSPTFAVLIDKSSSHKNVAPADVSAEQTDSKEWILFPYEVETDEEEQEKAMLEKETQK